MTDKETGEESIAPDEHLARFILQRSHLRSDGTIKQDVFIPYPWPDLSVTRHLRLTEEQLWNIGFDVARQTAKTLHGRADVKAGEFQHHGLRVLTAPLTENQNHANVTNWPTEKSNQKHIAQKIAAVAGKAHKAPTGS
jgi:hypothetical protein